MEFEEWWEKDGSIGYSKYGAAEQAWHMRDKEVTELKTCLKQIYYAKGVTDALRGHIDKCLNSMECCYNA